MRESARILEFPWHDDQFYAAWLAQTSYYVSHSSRLLMLAAVHVPLSDPRLHRRFSVHAGEEKGHENLAERDAKALGHKVPDIGEFAETKAFYRSQYYAIDYLSPEAFFGYVLFLEGIAVKWGPAIREKVRANGAHRPTSFLDLHVDEDPDHVDKAFEAIGQLRPEVLPQIAEHMHMSFEQYLGMAEKCARWAQKSMKRSAA